MRRFISETIEKVKALFWREVRCEECGALLQHEYIVWGRTLTKCYKCNHFNFVVYRTPFNRLVKIVKEDQAYYNPNNDQFLQTALSENTESNERP